MGAVTGDVLTVVGPWETTGLDPSRAGYMFSRMEVVETLLDVDDQARLQPSLARRWDVSADGLQWRFALPAGRRFHDGSEVTPASVLACLRRALARPGVLQLAQITAMRVDGAQLLVQLARPFAPLPYLFTHSSTQVLAPTAFDTHGEVRSIIGSGRFAISKLSLPQQFDVTRFAAHPDNVGANPARGIHRARYISVSRAETRTLMVQSGQADLAFSLDPPSIRALQHDARAQLIDTMLPRTTFIKLNAGHRWLGDVRVRQAMSLCIQRQDIARALLRDPELGATQLFPPSMRRWHSAALPSLRTDLAASRALLDAAGWRPGADGIRRNAAGERFELTLATFVDRPELPLVAAAVQEQMRQVGIAVRVLIGNSSDIPAGHRSGTLQLALAARNFGNLPDPVATLLQDFGPAGGDWGAMGWDDREVGATLAGLADGRLDGPAAKAARSRVATVLQQQLPVIPVVWYRQTCALSRRIEGASLDAFERSYRLSRLQWT
ncbi:ABC transporter substrate-binding protein [Herbaspirillum sp. YR522]|uniref:ABC transporter substrate-binding protein n=1 Tax=Herbaspirillum sp. YR522 TaxID=1144342 RepID=UPI00026FCDDE|nr:ABC-type dipeptide transport system, periplasmic component [Herbaspirillum sp. YR522]